MTGTPNLNITELTTNQNNKVVDINNGFVKMDGATQGSFSPAFTSNARTLTADEFTSNYEFVVPSLSATGTLTVPLTKRVFAVNNTGNASHDVKVKGSSGGTVDVPASTLMELRNTGTDIVGFGATLPRNKGAAMAQWVSGAIVANTTLYFSYKTPYAGTVDSLDYFAGTGSFTVAVKINGTNVTGLSAIAVNSGTPANTAASGAKTFAAGDTISGVITSAASSPTDALLNLNMTWT